MLKFSNYFPCWENSILSEVFAAYTNNHKSLIEMNKFHFEEKKNIIVSFYWIKLNSKLIYKNSELNEWRKVFLLLNHKLIDWTQTVVIIWISNFNWFKLFYKCQFDDFVDFEWTLISRNKQLNRKCKLHDKFWYLRFSKWGVYWLNRTVYMYQLLAFVHDTL